MGTSRPSQCLSRTKKSKAAGGERGGQPLRATKMGSGSAWLFPGELQAVVRGPNVRTGCTVGVEARIRRQPVPMQISLSYRLKARHFVFDESCGAFELLKDCNGSEY